METQLQYGKGDLNVESPSSDVTVLVPKHEDGLPDEAAFRESVRNPIGSAPLREIVGATEKVANFVGPTKVTRCFYRMRT